MKSIGEGKRGFFCNFNRSVTVRRLTAVRLRKTQSGLRHLCVFSPPHFFVRWNCFAIPLSQPQKRQLPRTLCNIWAEIIVNIK